MLIYFVSILVKGRHSAQGAHNGLANGSKSNKCLTNTSKTPRNDPEEFQIDIYPTYYWGLHFSGLEFQQGVDEFAMNLEKCKNWAEDHNKDLWVTIQTHFWGPEVEDSLSYCGENIPPYGYGGKWYCSGLIRPPTGNEVRLQTFLALCYGSDAILHFNYPSSIDSSNPNQWYLKLGLYDHIADTTTEMWREIAHFTSPRMEMLSPVFNQLTWQGACIYDSVGSFVLGNGDSSYIDSIIGINMVRSVGLTRTP